MNQRLIPSVERLRQAVGAIDLPRPVVVRLIREELAAIRTEARTPGFESIVERILGRATSLRRARLQPVINATGVIIHTNLGRAPLSSAAVQRLAAVAAGYSNLEFDLESGARGSRSALLERQLALLARADAAAVVNNCAAALVLLLRCFTRRPVRTEVIISRGELIQIGGGFRVPEILEASGASLREVGTTNRTELADYARALSASTALILKVHRSNFSMEGFVAETSVAQLAALARKSRIPLGEDLGSGALVDTANIRGLPHERTPAESIQDGADLVCFSGDKLMGGPQAGIIAGRERWIATLKKEPLFRALRCDKLVLAALEATTNHYLDGNAADTVPVIALARTSLDDLRARAIQLQQGLASAGIGPATGRYDCRVAAGRSRLGGGTLPSGALDSVTLELRPRMPGKDAAALAAALRHGLPPVVATIAGGWLKLDLRTVLPTQDTDLLRAMVTAIQGME